MESRQAYVDSHRLNDSIQETILAGRVISGMTKDDVYATWGWPSETDTSETLGLNGQYEKEVWIYRPSGHDTRSRGFLPQRRRLLSEPRVLSTIPED